MKRSQFIIAQDGFSNDTVLLYSTFSTSIVELERSMYSEIFEHGKYESHPEETAALADMGFLIPDDLDEKAFLKGLREKTLEANASSPSYYIICPTTGCNARCYYCFEKGINQRRMSKETAEALAKYIVEHHDPDHLVIQWFGGEPLLEPDTISYIVKYLKDNHVKFESKIITNGYLLSDEIVQRLAGEWNVRIIQITIDDLGEEYNRIKDYVHPDGNPFEIVMSNISRTLRAGINTRIRINFNPMQEERAIRTANYLKERFGGDPNFFVYFAPIDSKEIPAITESFEDRPKHPLLRLLDAEEEFCSFGNYDLKTEKAAGCEAVLKKYYLTPIPTSCYGGCQSSLTVDSEGNIFVCHRLLGNPAYASGNVFTGRVHNEIARFFTDPDLHDPVCEDCALLPLCHGGCKHRAFTYGKQHACTMIKGAAAELIRRAAEEIRRL